jgi:hypothetical protein
VEILESVVANPGTDYDWYYGYYVDYTDPYTGNCGSQLVSQTDTVSIHTTVYTDVDGGPVFCT